MRTIRAVGQGDVYTSCDASMRCKRHAETPEATDSVERVPASSARSFISPKTLVGCAGELGLHTPSDVLNLHAVTHRTAHTQRRQKGNSSLGNTYTSAVEKKMTQVDESSLAADAMT